MKMKYNNLLIPFLIACAVSCAEVKEVPYFQDARDGGSSQVAYDGRITLQPDDKISIIVKSRDADLTNLFNLPYYTQRIGQTREMSSNYASGVAGYLVNPAGEIDFPILGKIKVAGMTRSALSDLIQTRLIEEDLVKDPVVSIDYMNLNVSVMGEVVRPGRYAIDNDSFTILDAVSAAGDLTIYGVRSNVKVVRNIGGEQKIYTVNLGSAEEVAKSPVYYLRQNDVVYVEPNKMRARQSTVNGNNVLSTSFWISLSSLAVTVLLAIKQFTK